ncbi:hypothetical protein F2P79_019829 [Pimephales promelas]|nr:hypothetical protein F2P79_019829 [Pimephales promelas]
MREGWPRRAFRWRIKLVPILTASSTHTHPKHHPHTLIPPVRISPVHLLLHPRAGSPSLDRTGPHTSREPDRTGVLSNHEIHTHDLFCLESDDRYGFGQICSTHWIEETVFLSGALNPKPYCRLNTAVPIH